MRKPRARKGQRGSGEVVICPVGLGVILESITPSPSSAL